MRRATVSANVGMACLGSLLVRTCSIPSPPYQFLSLILPRAIVSHSPYQLPGSVSKSGYVTVPTESVVRDKSMQCQVEVCAAIRNVHDIPGSWNMITTSSRETCTSADECYGEPKPQNANAIKYRSRCLLLHRGWRPRSLRECFQENEPKPGTC